MSKTNFVYVVEAENGRIKIGVSVSPTRRLMEIRTHSPLLVRLVAQWVEDEAPERTLHDMLKNSRSHCEWFLPSPEVDKFLEAVRGTGVDHIPEWNEIDHTSADVRARAKRDKLSATHRARFSDPVIREEFREVMRAYHKRRREQLDYRYSAAAARYSA